MKTALRFSTPLASALLVFSCAAAASAEDFGLPPVEEPDPRTHLLSAHIVSVPVHLDAEHPSGFPLIFGIVGDYQYSFGLVRLGLGLQYMHTWKPRRAGIDGEGIYESSAHELGIPVRLSFGGTTSNGIDIAGTLGVGYGRVWSPRYDGWTSEIAGPYVELLASVAVPVSQSVDVSFRGGFNLKLYRDQERGQNDDALDPRYFRALNNLEVGLRKRF
jgi:hypothetical protein